MLVVAVVVAAAAGAEVPALVLVLVLVEALAATALAGSSRNSSSHIAILCPHTCHAVATIVFKMAQAIPVAERK